jgi:hypothetical protein
VADRRPRNEFEVCARREARERHRPPKGRAAVHFRKHYAERVEPHQIGIRSHDINHGVVGVSMALIENYFRPTRLVGVAAQIASLVADQDVVPYDALIASCAELGIGGELTDRALAILQEIAFARVVQRGGRTVVEVRAIGLRDRYENLGDEWENQAPSDIERLTLELLNDLALMPRKAHELALQYDLRPHQIQIIKSIAENAGVIRSYVSPVDGEEIWYSPLYWEENPEKLFGLASQHPSELIVQALNKIRLQPGLPDTQVDSRVLRDAVNTGIFPTPSIDSFGGKHHFVFLPPRGLKLEEKTIADRAMAFVSCARYAENFAQGRLRYAPVVLLEALLRKRRLSPHPEASRQWGPLATLRVVRVEPVGSLFAVSLVDSPENVRALRLAIQILSVGEAEYDDEAVQQARQLVIPGTFANPTRTRVAYRQSAQYSETPLSIVHKIISGVSPDLIE